MHFHLRCYAQCGYASTFTAASYAAAMSASRYCLATNVAPEYPLSRAPHSPF